jgi:hypothetical protein
MRRPSASGHAVAAVDASGMNSATPYMGGTHAAAMKSSTAAETATSAAPRQCVIGNQTGSNENSCREADQTVSHHGSSPDVGASSIRWLSAMMQRQRRLALGDKISGSVDTRLM